MFYSWNIIPAGSSDEFPRLLGCMPTLNLQFEERLVTTRLRRLKKKKKRLFIP